MFTSKKSRKSSSSHKKKHDSSSQPGADTSQWNEWQWHDQRRCYYRSRRNSKGEFLEEYWEPQTQKTTTSTREGLPNVLPATSQSEQDDDDDNDEELEESTSSTSGFSSNISQGLGSSVSPISTSYGYGSGSAERGVTKDMASLMITGKSAPLSYPIRQNTGSISRDVVRDYDSPSSYMSIPESSLTRKESGYPVLYQNLPEYNDSVYKDVELDRSRDTNLGLRQVWDRERTPGSSRLIHEQPREPMYTDDDVLDRFIEEDAVAEESYEDPLEAQALDRGGRESARSNPSTQRPDVRKRDNNCECGGNCSKGEGCRRGGGRRR